MPPEDGAGDTGLAGGFHVATVEEIRAGAVTDVYFLRGKRALEHEGVDPVVVAEVRTTTFPHQWPWAVLAGVDEAIELLRGHDVDMDGLGEGSAFLVEEPVLTIRGRYLDFGVLETALLGLLCQASGVATKAARCRLAAGDVPLYSFGARRMHPAVAPMIERAAFVGGCDGVAAVISGTHTGTEPVGTMAHAAMLVLGDERAWRAFDATMPPDVPRVALVDTFRDEKFGALAAAETLGDRIAAVRLDTPGSRRGDFAAIIREVRWELDRRGHTGVRIFVSGGLDEAEIERLAPLVGGFGVGTAISNAPVVDFALDIVEVDGRAIAKRGKRSGRKRLWGCAEGHARGVTPAETEPPPCPVCDRPGVALHRPLLRSGEPAERAETARDVRARSLAEARRFATTPPATVG